MTRTCGTCGRSWARDATFCGVCGALLDTTLAARETPSREPSAWWRRPATARIGVAVAIVVVVAAVPTLSVQDAPPVDGAIGVPDADQLQTPPRSLPVREAVEAPTVVCRRGGRTIDCLRWSRPLGPPPPQRGSFGTWVMAEGDRVVVASEDHLEGVDADTGTRLWRTERAAESFPMGLSADTLVVGTGRSTDVLDLDDGSTRWSVSSGTSVHGLIAQGDVVYTGTSAVGEPGLVARAADDGAVLWTWPVATSTGMYIRPLAGDRLLVTFNDNRHGVGVLDAHTGEPHHALDALPGQWIIDVAGDVAVTVAQPAPSSPNRGGDPGATLHGVDLTTGETVWDRRVRVSEVGFRSIAGVVLAPSSRRLTAIDMRTGRIAWEVSTARMEQVAEDGLWSFFGAAGPPAGMVVTTVPGQRSVVARDPATGTPVWERDIGATIEYAIATRDEVILAADDGQHVLDARTGQDLLVVETRHVPLVQRDPLVLFDPRSGHVLRLDEPPATP